MRSSISKYIGVGGTERQNALGKAEAIALQNVAFTHLAF